MTCSVFARWHRTPLLVVQDAGFPVMLSPPLSSKLSTFFSPFSALLSLARQALPSSTSLAKQDLPRASVLRTVTLITLPICPPTLPADVSGPRCPSDLEAPPALQERLLYRICLFFVGPFPLLPRRCICLVLLRHEPAGLRRH